MHHDLMCVVMPQTWEGRCNPEVHQGHTEAPSEHPTGARTQRLPLPRWGIVWRQLLLWQQDGQMEAEMSDKEGSVKTVRSIPESLSCGRAAADETPTRSSTKEQMIMQQESNPQRLLGGFWPLRYTSNIKATPHVENIDVNKQLPLCFNSQIYITLWDVMKKWHWVMAETCNNLPLWQRVLCQINFN